MLIVNLTSQSSRGCCVISCFRARLILCFILNFTFKKKTKNNSKHFGGLFGQALVKRVCLTRWFQSNTQNITKKLSTVPCNLCRLSYVLLCVFGIYGKLFRKKLHETSWANIRWPIPLWWQIKIKFDSYHVHKNTLQFQTGQFFL